MAGRQLDQGRSLPESFLTSGGPAGDEWGTSPTDTYAELAARRLIKLGIPGDLCSGLPRWIAGTGLIIPPSRSRRGSRTHNFKVSSFDIVTQEPDARRSWLLYEKAFGGDVEVGTIATEYPKVDDPAHWWRSSEGVREAMSEAIAYGYARLFFHPSSPVASQ